MKAKMLENPEILNSDHLHLESSIMIVMLIMLMVASTVWNWAVLLVTMNHH
jgi:hypothetical protein